MLADCHFERDTNLHQHLFEPPKMDMGELSDSASTNYSHPSSRPVTPPPPILEPTTRQHADSHMKPAFQTDVAQSHPYTLAIKLQKILGLRPDTIAYARAALEQARDQVRRTSGLGLKCGGSPPAAPVSSWKVTEKLRRRLSLINLPSATDATLQRRGEKGSRLKVGGAKEEEFRERRRRATDGLIYWQKEVARLEAGAGL